MKNICVLFFALVGAGCADRATSDVSAEILAKERAALDRWVRGDTGGYVALFAPEITYFDPTRDRRVTGRDALLEFMRTIQFPPLPKEGVTESKFVDAKVQQFGDVAVLTFNTDQEGSPVRWNSTEVYARIDGDWKIVHSHWSIVKPPLPAPIAGGTAN